jgi:hypothetical protein
MFKEGDFIVVKQDYPPYEQFGVVSKPMGDLHFAETADGFTTVFTNDGVRAGGEKPTIRLATAEEVARLTGPDLFVVTTITPFQRERITVERIPSLYRDHLHAIARSLKQPTVEDLLKAALNIIDADKCSENDMACVCIEKALVWLSIAEK